MITRFDHAILAVNSLQNVVTDLRTQFGFDAKRGGKHTGLGTENAMIRFGLDYIELLGVHDRNEVIAAGVKRQSLLDYIDDNDGGWLAFSMATDNIRRLAKHFNDIGLRSLGPYPMERVRPDGSILRWQLLVPEHSAWRKPWPFFIQWELPDDERIQLEQPGQHACGNCKVTGVRLIVRDLEAAEYLYVHQLGFEKRPQQPLHTPGAHRTVVGLDNFTIILIQPYAPGPMMDWYQRYGEGLIEVVVQAADRNAAINAPANRIVPGVSDTELTLNLLAPGSKDSKAYFSIVE